MAKLIKILNDKDRVEPKKMTAAQIAKAKAIKAAALAASRKPAPSAEFAAKPGKPQISIAKPGPVSRPSPGGNPQLGAGSARKPALPMKPPKDDSKLLSMLPVTRSHLNTIKKHYGI